MEVTYRTRKLEKVCTNASVAQAQYGSRMAELIQLRIDQLMAADNAAMLVQFQIGRCHPLHGNRQGTYAMDLVHPYRLIFEQINNNIVIANIIEIVDYH